METNNEYTQENMDRWMKEHSERSKRGKIAGGIILVIIGAGLLIHQMDPNLIPHWIFSWKTILIAVGLFIGAKHGFKGGGWLIPILIGGVFIAGDFYPEMHLRQYLWPLVIICAGLFMIFRRRDANYYERKMKWKKSFTNGGYVPPTADEKLDITTVFSGAKKNVISKNFKGGDVTNIFGGSEVNMSQADFIGTITLDSTQIFGGAKFLIPANWSVQSDVTCVFGSVEDNRPLTNEKPDPSKILLLRGTCIFGGIEITSY